MIIGLFKELDPETRVSLLPEHITALQNGIRRFAWNSEQALLHSPPMNSMRRRRLTGRQRRSDQAVRLSFIHPSAHGK